MDSRFNLIKTSLEKAIEMKLVHVIFDYIYSHRRPIFVQFELNYEDNMAVLDIPGKVLTSPEVVRAERIFKKEAPDMTGERNGSFQEVYDFNKIDEATQMVENIFRFVFLLPSDYSITVEYM